MSKALIISDNRAMASVIETKFSNAGWSNESVTIHSMMGRGSASVRNHHCIVLVIGTDFRKRFSSIIDEMGAIIRNCSIHTPLYLLFEDDYDPCFASWVQHAKRLFKSATHHDNLRDAIQEVIRLETESVPRTAFCSPMD